jgi:hypothetical protein
MAYVEYQISSNTDDAYQRSNTLMEVYLAYIAYGSYNNSLWTGLRFQGITLPVGAYVTEAYLNHYAYVSDSNNMHQDFWAEDGASPGTFTTGANNISNRTRTTATIGWSPAPWVAGNWYKSPNLKTLIQELVDTYDYSTGADMVLISKFDSVGLYERLFYSHDNNPGASAKLQITFDPDPIVTASQVTAYTETEQNISRVSQAIAYAETETILLKTSQIITYIEMDVSFGEEKFGPKIQIV